MVSGGAREPRVVCESDARRAVAIPLVTQLILGPVKVISSELFQAHVLGKVLPRPFEVPKSPFAEMLSGFTGANPAIEDAKPKKAKSVDTKKSR